MWRTSTPRRSTRRPSIPRRVDPTPDDPAVTPDEPAPPVVEPEPETPTVDPAALTVGTNVGTTLKKDDSGRFDCTIRMSDSIQLILRGTDAAVTWSSEDTSVVTVSADGKLKPVKAGTANVTAERRRNHGPLRGAHQQLKADRERPLGVVL